MMQAVIMRAEVAVVTVLPGGKGHRGFDPSLVDISWRPTTKRAAEIDAGPLTRWGWCGWPEGGGNKLIDVSVL